ncbi:M81 family metallopeptidase [Dactylosporangium fulvum]|uniref:M81 family metallopeptidase n=1 Tax=Dactylosporangium fulvum TaxID=53359 RepID=A0ABY5W972_9ACTN|nr:M81 family metallopeptidase [Dactylosporangium fulvum]UWP85559.1 M81 family metallopeptidase [Dactylosporangium fulvum]
MKLRVAVGGLSHETNQYSSTSTEFDDFEIVTGRAVFERHAGRTYVGGMVAAASEAGAEVVGTLHAEALPAGTIARTAYQRLKQALLESLGAVLPVDGVLLDLHGAAAAEGVDDVEGDICRAVRDLIGPAVPLVVTHDLHGNISQAEADVVDAMFGVHHYPHDDMFERGQEAMRAVSLIARGRWRPYVHVERLPLLVPQTTTYEGIGAKAREICQRFEEQDGILDCTFMHGFPYADHAFVGAQVVTIADNSDNELARRVARDAARLIWALRDEFTVDYPNPDEALRLAEAGRQWPVVVNEVSDNPGGGAPGDGTHLLRALLAARPENAVFVGIKDPDVVRQAIEAGVGATIDIRLGGKTDTLHGAPIECRAYVKLLSDGEVVLEAPMGRGWRYPLGRSARLVIDGVDVVVISRAMQTLDRTPLLLHGIDAARCNLIALKSAHHFRSGFGEVAKAVVSTDPPGLSTMRLDTFPRSRTPRPVYPLDAHTTYGD